MAAAGGPGVGKGVSSDFSSATFVLHIQATSPEKMAVARDIMKTKLKASGWAEFSHRKSSTGTITCIYTMEGEEEKRRDVYALLTGALMSADDIKWILSWTTQHRASEIIEFFSAK